MRPLNSRGKRNAPAMAQRFVERGESLDLIVSSPAERARSTARAFAAATGIAKSQFIELESLYFGGLSAFREAIRDQADAVNSLMLVSHNPDVTSFANSLDQQLYIDNVPTCGLLCFDCDVDSWSNWSPNSCRFVYYDYPKNPDSKPQTNLGLVD